MKLDNIYEKDEKIWISVIVPVYNTKEYLEKCVESILNQTYPYIEIILVDDGSSDGSLSICKKLKKMDYRISLITQIRQGVNHARKNGLKIAKGELVSFVDSDDWIEPDMYEQMILIYKQFPVDMVSTGVFREYESSGKKIEVCDNYAEGVYSDLKKDIYPTMLRNNDIKDFGLYCTIWNKLFIKEKVVKVFKNLNMNIFYGEDSLIVYAYCLSIDSLYISKKSYYHYNIHPNSTCWRIDERLPYNTYLLYQELKKIFLKYSNPAILMKQLRRYILDVELHNLQVLYNIDLNVFGKWKFQYESYYNSRIIIYGAGQCGQAFYHQLSLCKTEHNIVAWVDENYSQKSEQCLYDIESPEIIPNLKYDFIIIAVMDERLACKIRNKLIDLFKIKKEVIVWKEIWHEPLLDEIL